MVMSAISELSMREKPRYSILKAGPNWVALQNCNCLMGNFRAQRYLTACLYMFFPSKDFQVVNESIY